MMKSWCLSDYGDTQSTKEQLNCSLLWEVKVTYGIGKYMQAQEACLIGSPGFFWPFQLKWRQERGRGMPVLFVPSTWWERKGIKYSQRWASNGPKTIKVSWLGAHSFRQMKKRGDHSSLFCSLATGPPLTFHSPWDLPVAVILTL